MSFPHQVLDQPLLKAIQKSHFAFLWLRGLTFFSRLAFCTGLLFLCSQTKIPFFIPFTLQTLAVHWISLSMAPAMAMWSVLSWITLGVSGLPVSASVSGPALLVGPTGGYVVGMLLSAGLVSWLYRHPSKILEKWMGKKHQFLRIFLCGLLGNGITLLLGWAHLSWVLGSYHQAFWVGFAPFLVPEVFKAFTLACLAKRSATFQKTHQSF